MKTGSCYWRFKGGDKAYRYGYATFVGNGLYRMGLWNGDTTRGPLIDPADIEVKG